MWALESHILGHLAPRCCYSLGGSVSLAKGPWLLEASLWQGYYPPPILVELSVSQLVTPHDQPPRLHHFPVKMDCAFWNVTQNQVLLPSHKLLLSAILSWGHWKSVTGPARPPAAREVPRLIASGTEAPHHSSGLQRKHSQQRWS